MAGTDWQLFLILSTTVSYPSATLSNKLPEMEPGSFRTLSLTTKVVPWHKCTPEKHYKSRPLPVSTSMLFFELRPQQLFAYAGLLSQEGNIMKKLFATATLLLPFALAGCSHPQPAPFIRRLHRLRPTRKRRSRAIMTVLKRRGAILPMGRLPILTVTHASANLPCLHL